MKLGVFLVLFADWPLEEALAHVKEVGCEAVELGTGGYSGKAHCNPKRLLEDAETLKAFRQAVERTGLEISALSCHGNPLHPNKDIARAHDEDFRNTVRLAAELGVEQVVTFSGCPGDSEGSKKPNWVTCPWPPDFLETLEWQWNERVVPYWKEAASFVRENGVKVAIEPHPGFIVYNADSFRRFREIGGDNVGVNFDPSHLFWQQANPLVWVRELKDYIFHVHAKDTWVDPQNTKRNGVLDTKEYADVVNRSWTFRTVGYGHGLEFWRALISELKLASYDGVISVEHEDPLMGTNEGFEKAVDFLKDAIIGNGDDEAR